MILFLAIAGVVILLDQTTKYWIIATLKLHEGFAVVDGFFNIVHVRNPGAAFGFMAGASPAFRSVFFVAITLAAILLILHYLWHYLRHTLRQTGSEKRSLVFSLSLILAGAVGNLIDRVRFGEVVDFLDVYVGTHHWPAFNVADASISTGAAVLAIALFVKRKEGADAAGSDQ
ncbi:MAG: signal peptidase II [Syntrophus sp. RIFOXYC2_FULL_54_9]|nr:MAG: signal peptidase II [Syntrophus sp. RIFOXYC2_FULL_54_9]